jgi:predicted nucleotidyltransferase
MNPNDPNTTVLELVADALGSLRHELVLVGGCSVGLLITDAARPPVRQTVDVDLVAQVTSINDYYSDLYPKLESCGFKVSPDHDNICRWNKGALIIDVMPSKDVLGHSTNVWYPDAVREAQSLRLPSGLEILVVSAPLFIATKIDAFHGRGKRDYAHHDMEDIINVIDGREELAAEIDRGPPHVKTFIEDEVAALLGDEAFVDALTGHFRPDQVSQARVEVLITRLRRLAGL